MNHPVKNYSKVFSTKDIVKSELAGKEINYICKSADSVKAIFGGRIIAVNEVGGRYLLMTQFGDYFISYYGLNKPTLGVGELIHTNQYISTLSSFAVGPVFLTVHFYYENDEIDPAQWLKRQYDLHLLSFVST